MGYDFFHQQYDSLFKISPCFSGDDKPLRENVLKHSSQQLVIIYWLSHLG